MAERTSRVVFVTSIPVHAGFGGLAGADAICQSAADGVRLGGTYRAWLSDSKIAARERLSHSQLPYVLVNGDRVANDWDDLIKNGPQVPIHLSETGHEPQPGSLDCAQGKLAWTDTNNDGGVLNREATCKDWTINMNETIYVMSAWGSWESTMAWTVACTGGTCNPTASLYCFEQ
jgi:hypothetical protein